MKGQLSELSNKESEKAGIKEEKLSIKGLMTHKSMSEEERKLQNLQEMMSSIQIEGKINKINFQISLILKHQPR